MNATVSHKVAVVVLAAGQSSRMGTPKQLLPWAETTLLGHCLSTVAQLEEVDIFVVLGAHAHKIQQQIEEFPVQILINPHWAEGLGSSLSFAVNAIVKEKDYSGIMVVLGDQPTINQKHLRALQHSFKADSSMVWATNYGTNPGVPAVFPPNTYAQLCGLQGDSGAKRILKTLGDRLQMLPTAPPPIDIDTLEDYEQYKPKI